jgi:L,D-transpeptidase ErfK/SrfK
VTRRRLRRLLLIAAALVPAAPAAAATYPLAPSQAAIGDVATYTTRASDNLLDLARAFDLGYTQLVAANRGVDPWRPGSGRKIVVPARYLVPDVPRRGIVVSLDEQRLYYFPPSGGAVETYPIGVGVVGRHTPVGVTSVVAKSVEPIWYPPPSIRAEDPDLPTSVPPGPDNPLGAFALRLGWAGFLIHGTNKPDGVGRNVSHGCLHLYPEDIARLFAEVPVGTPVRVVDRQFALEWIDQRLWLELYRTPAQADDLAVSGRFRVVVPAGLEAAVARAAGDRAGEINWDAVRRAALERTGLPVDVTATVAAAASLTR